MGYDELNILEKMYIYFRCCRDIKKGRISGTKIGIENLCAFKTFNKISDEKKVISPFVTTELSHLIAKKNQMLEKKWCIYKYITDSNAISRDIKKFPDAIAVIDDMVRKLEGKISCIDKEYAVTMAELQKKYNSNIARKAYHLAKANVKAAHAGGEQIRREKRAIYEQLMFLLSEKIRLINCIDARIDVIKAWRFLRIRHYYGLACNKDYKLPIFIYSEEDFSEICGESLSDEYTRKLEDAEKKYHDIKDNLKEAAIKETEYPQGSGGIDGIWNADSPHGIEDAEEPDGTGEAGDGEEPGGTRDADSPRGACNADCIEPEAVDE